MRTHDRALGPVGRDLLFRPIVFERYRKPHIVEYPPHATVLNPQHTQHLRQGHRAAALTNGDVSAEDEAEAPSSGSDSDDPRHLEAAAYLCSDAALASLRSLGWRQVGPVGVGLVNLGNTCFANSVLQALAYTPALAQYFAETFKAPDQQMGAPYDFAYALGETIRRVHLARGAGGAAHRPSLLLGHLRSLSSHFRLGQQGDAHEFAVQLLFACQKSLLFRQVGSRKVAPHVAHTTALLRLCGGYLRSQVSWRRREEMAQLLKAGKRQAATDLQLRLQGKSPVPEDLHSNTYDPFSVLNVEVAGHTLEHCLAKFCEVETLEGRCYHTPRDVAVRATKQFQIHHPPHVLLIHLKRFLSTGAKVGKFIQYPKELDLAPYCTASASHPPTTAGGAVTRYLLHALCVHEGHSLHHGHYYSVVRARNGAWYECNDSLVRPIGEDRALGQQAYMLFYSRAPPTGRPVTRPDASAFRYRPPRTLPLPAPVTAPPATAPEEVGEALSEAQLEALRHARSSTAVEDTARTPDAAPHEMSRRAGHKRSHDAASSSDEDAPGERDAGLVGLVRGTTRPGPSSVPPTETPRTTRVPRGYGGIVRAMRSSTSLRPPSAAPTSDGSVEAGPVSRTGRHAVVALEHHRSETTPETLRRPSTAPKFQQKIRDPLWEMEMDRGRVKKVRDKTRAPDHAGGENLFQLASSNRFDSRGRRLRE